MPKQITPTKTNKAAPTASTATTTITAASPATGKMLSVAQLLAPSSAVRSWPSAWSHSWCDLQSTEASQ